MNSKKIDFEKQINAEKFPHITEKFKVKATIANLRYLLNHYGITCSYDEILKKQTVKLNINNDSDNDLSETSTAAQIKSLLGLNQIPLNTIDLLPAIIEQSRYNPIIDFIKSKEWDGFDRFPEVLECLVSNDDARYKELAVKTWLVQCVAAADGAKHSPITDAHAKFELVLVLQGGQGIGKTTWFKSLLPLDLRQYIVDGVHLDPADKDSVKKCISSWICELGEIDSTFRKSDIARLKAFLSNTHDEIRLPYDRVSSNFKRRTCFGASVNKKEFLVDETGSRRFLPLSVNHCFVAEIDFQQLWAQVWQMYTNGHQWWCNKELENFLVSKHAEHAEICVIHELIKSVFSNSKDKTGLTEHLTITEILKRCGVNVPTSKQIKEAKDYLEKNDFDIIQKSGVRGYWITPYDNFERQKDEDAKPIDAINQSREKYYQLYPDERPN